MRHLTDRLSIDLGFVELNVHTLWALIRRKPDILDNHPAVLREVVVGAERLRDEDVSSQARRELDAVLYGIAMRRRQ